MYNLHSRGDCSTCFDWYRLQCQAANKKNRGLVEDRSLLLGLLGSMGIEMPASTKLSNDALEKKVAFALDYAQDIATLSIIFRPIQAPFQGGRYVCKLLLESAYMMRASSRTRVRCLFSMLFAEAVYTRPCMS
jgi:hypothetical protein